MTAVVRHLDVRQKRFLNEHQKSELLQLIYGGKSITEACMTLDIERARVELERMNDEQFNAAFLAAVEVLGDTYADLATKLLEMPLRGESVGERSLDLRRSIAQAAHLRWMADRTGKLYGPPSATAKERRSHAVMSIETSIPERGNE